MSSDVFYEKLVRDQDLAEIPGFHRHVWASFHRDVVRMRGDDFADQVERTLALA